MFTRMAYTAIALVALSGSTTNAIAEERPAGLVAGLRAPGTQQPMLPDGSFLVVRRTRSNQ